MKIPFLDLKAQYQSIKDEINIKVLDLFSSQNFILGSEVTELEKDLASYSGNRFAVGVSSGSDALLVSLMAIGVKNGDAVLTTPFTFFATVGAIARLGARVVFCDIDRTTFNMSPESLEQVLKKEMKGQERAQIKAIIPIHLYGQCADMDPIMELAQKYQIPVVEDAAQSFGSEYPSSSGVKKACGMGDLGILSFFPSKNLGGYGDGGMVLTNNEDLAEKLKVLRVHGAKNKYFHEIIGGNFRLDAIQAAVLRVKFKYLDNWLQKRKDNAALYDRLFQESGLLEKGCILRPETVYKMSGVQNYHTYNQYVIRATSRDELQNFLKNKGIATAIYYPLGLHLQTCFAHLGYRKGDFPESERATEEVLALPVYPELSEEQQEYIVTNIKEFYNK